MVWISPNFQNVNFPGEMSLDQKIDVFADRVRGWQLDIAQQCASIPHSGFAVLHIVTSYFEMIAKFKAGYAQSGGSKRYFKEGIYDVFPDLRNLPQNLQDAVIEKLYEDVRCGLYHGGITGPSIILTGDVKEPIAGNDSQIIINPRLFVSSIQENFNSYIQKLRDSNNVILRNNFETRFDYQSR